MAMSMFIISGRGGPSSLDLRFRNAANERALRDLASRELLLHRGGQDLRRAPAEADVGKTVPDAASGKGYHVSIFDK